MGTNSYSLYNVGPMADKVFGPVRFLAVYLFSGICANVITYALGTSPASLGASGMHDYLLSINRHLVWVTVGLDQD